MTKRASYREGIEIIALNDEPLVMDEEEVAAYTTVGLLADLFGKTTEQVARDVIRYRKKHAPEGESK